MHTYCEVMPKVYEISRTSCHVYRRQRNEEGQISCPLVRQADVANGF
jgi:hypothetical protein